MNTPVLILAHDRPELLRKCLERLESAGCVNLFASIDGPSNSKRAEQEKVVSILSEIISPDKLNLIQTNLGCEKGVLNGIDWFFSKTEKGIIIEEDVLISNAGLQFLDEMLVKYQSEPSVFMAGAHLPTGKWNTNQSYFLSRVGHIWGWATWKNRWDKHDPNSIKSLIDSELIANSFGQTELAKHFNVNLEACLSGQVDTWDFQWNMTMLANNGVCALPNSNQIENIGISADALHTTDLHEGVCNSFQDPISSLSISPEIKTDREYEQEWLRRLKGETEQLKTKTDKQELKDQPVFDGSVCLVSSTEIGGGAEKICHSIFNSSRPTDQRFLVAVKKTVNPKVVELGKPSRIERWLQPESELISQTKSADVIHLHNIHDMGFGWEVLLNLAETKPIVWTLHDQWILGKNIDPPFVEGDSIPKKKLAFINHKNVHLVTPSLWLQDKVYWKTRKLPTLIKYGIDTDIYRPLDRSTACQNLDLDQSKKRILFIAKNPQSNPYKDFAGLKKAWIKANQELGNGGYDLIALGGLKTTETHGNQTLKVISFTQNETDVCSWINACDLMIHATHSDNSPVSILEAMACKTPVVATNIGGINEQLDGGNCGTLIPSDSVTALAESIINHLHNPDLKQHKIEAAFARISNEHTKAHMIDAYLGLYSKVNR
ncbi:MAG: glycosyltransferase involved in cell wall biosynthesis [Granulosicoccus sp.]|jgi:glycosyltransferase involved in cell wall biosynthesis